VGYMGNLWQVAQTAEPAGIETPQPRRSRTPDVPDFPGAAPAAAPKASKPGFWGTVLEIAKNIPIRMGQTTFSLAGIEQQARHRDFQEEQQQAWREEQAERRRGRVPIGQAYPDLPGQMYPAQVSETGGPRGGAYGGGSLAGSPDVFFALDNNRMPNTQDFARTADIGTPGQTHDANKFMRTLVGMLPMSDLANVYRTETQRGTKDATQVWREEQERLRQENRRETERERQHTRTETERQRLQGRKDTQVENTRRTYLQTMERVGVGPDATQGVLAAENMPDLHKAYTEAMQKTQVPVLMPDGSTQYMPAAQADRHVKNQQSLAAQQQTMDARKSPEQLSMEGQLRSIDNLLSREPNAERRAALQQQRFATQVNIMPFTFPNVPRRTMTSAQLDARLQGLPENQRGPVLKDIMQYMVQAHPSGYIISGITAEEAVALAKKYGVSLD